MSACNNFVENVWSKGKCSNCFKSLASHRSAGVERTRKSGKLFDTGTNGITKEHEHHTNSSRWISRSNGVELRDGQRVVVKEESPPARTKIAKSPVMKQRDPGERKVKPALSPRPKPVPKPRQRTSNVGLVCGQNEESFSQRQTLSKVEQQRPTETLSDSKNSKPVSGGGESINTRKRETERDLEPEIPLSKTEKNVQRDTVENQRPADKEHETCTVLPSENNHLESAETDSSRKDETQYEGGEDEYVPMKDNVFDIVKIMESCGADVLDPNGDKTRSYSETSTASSNSVFNGSEQRVAEVRDESSENADKNTVGVGKPAKKSETEVWGNPNEADCINSVSSDSCRAGASDPPTRLVGKNPSLADSQKSAECKWNSSMFESSSDVQENSAGCLEAEGVSSRKQSLGDLCIKGTLHSHFGHKALRRQSNPDIKEQMPEPPVYVNANVKPSPKPYKVVDVSTGMLVPDDHNQTPPLPPKAKDLVLDSVSHEYMDPTVGPCGAVTTGEVGRSRGCAPSRPYSAINLSNGAVVTSSRSDPSDLGRHSMLAPCSQSFISPDNGTLGIPGPVSKALKEEKPQMGDGATQSGESAAVKPGPLLPPKVASDDANTSVCQLSTQEASNVPKPTRSAPTRPNYTPPVVSCHRDSVVSVSSVTSSGASIQTQETQENLPTTKSSSPKSAIRKAFTSMKRIGSKKRSKRRTLEISGPILVNEEIPSFAAQREAVRQRTLSEGNVLQASLPKGARSTESQVEPAPEGQTTSPPLPTRKRQGYENYPFSRTGDTVERPTKPPRKAKAAIPARNPAPAQAPQTEEPAYLQPCQDELTFKVEAALANLNDATILAEALSRVEQEKLGPLPAIPKSRHVRFHIASPEPSPTPNSSATKLGLPPPVGTASGDPPELPSRPPDRAASKKPSNHRGRSQSVREVRNPDSRAVKLTRSQSLSAQENILERRYNKLLKLQMQTLKEVVGSQRTSLLPEAGLDWSHTQWADYEVCGATAQLELPGAVLLPVTCSRISGHHKLLAKVHTWSVPPGDVQVNLKQVALKNDLHFCKSLPYHVNTARVLTHFNSTIPGDVIGQAGGGAYHVTIAITDQSPVETVAKFVERTVAEHESSPEAYERKVCFLLVQILSGLAHLSKEGVVHWDLTLDNLLLLEHEHLVISNFTSASRPPDVRTDRRLHCAPPELAVPPKSGARLDYSKCDCFAVGCLIYELLHRKNPFAANVALAQQDYSLADLPAMCRKSRYSRGLGTVAAHLLLVDPAGRASAGQALQLVRMLLWGPAELDGECLQSAAGDWLETERAQMVAKLARSQMQAEPTAKGYLETLLKGQYLYDATEEALVQCYTLLQSARSTF